MFVQSHTPFAGLDEYKDKTVLVVGGDGDKCREVAERYTDNSSSDALNTPNTTTRH